LGITNPERAVVEESDTNKSLEFKNSEQTVVEISHNQKKKQHKNIICRSMKRSEERNI